MPSCLGDELSSVRKKKGCSIAVVSRLLRDSPDLRAFSTPARAGFDGGSARSNERGVVTPRPPGSVSRRRTVR